MHVRQSLHCLEETVGRNMVLKGNSGQGSERKKESCRESSHGQRENEYHHEQNADRNIDVKVVLTEV